MPKFKGPKTLLRVAMNVLTDFYVKRCREYSIEGSLDKLCRWVSLIKQDIGPQIPLHLAKGLCKMIMEDCLQELNTLAECPESHKRAVIEIIMDTEIVGLSIIASDLDSMDPIDAHRIRGLQELVLDDSRCHTLRTFHIADLTMLTYCFRCTDTDLEIIGKNCPKLELLEINDSEHITDVGLCALGPCSELYHVEVRNCPKITHKGIQSLLSAHAKIQKLYALSSSPLAGFDCFTHTGWSVYPSIIEFEMNLEEISNTNLRRITVMFPNLRTLHINGDLGYSADLRTLGSLKKLCELEFRSVWEGFSWDNLKELLKLVGGNISSLRTCCPPGLSCCVTQADLNFLYEFCPNISILGIDHWAEVDGEILVIPPFKNLVMLHCTISRKYYQRFPVLQFGIMPKLMVLEIYRVEITTDVVESMILDNIRFPELRCLYIHEVSGNCDMIHIKEIAKTNNLELFIGDKVVV